METAWLCVHCQTEKLWKCVTATEKGRSIHTSILIYSNIVASNIYMKVWNKHLYYVYIRIWSKLFEYNHWNLKYNHDYNIVIFLQQSLCIQKQVNAIVDYYINVLKLNEASYMKLNIWNEAFSLCKHITKLLYSNGLVMRLMTNCCFRIHPK